MKKLLTLLALSSTTQLSAQGWSVHLGAGLSYSKLIPIEASTPSTRLFKYGFTKAGMYFSPELHFIASTHSEFSFGYQYSNNYIGLKFPGSNSENINGYVSDIYDLHTFSVGYHYARHVFKNSVNVKGFVRMGLAYGSAVGSGSGSSSGGKASTTYISYIKVQSDQLPTDGFWTPTSTIGIAVGPNLENRRLGDRLTLQASVTIGWKSPFRDYSKYEYVGYENNVQTWGLIQCKGLPLLAQIGLDYELFRFMPK